MSNFIENCRAYIVRVYEKKSGRYYKFFVLAETKPLAIDMVEKFCEEGIGSTCVVKKAIKLPNKPQILDYIED
jgi:hypothetical protein